MTTTPETHTEAPAAKTARLDLRSLFERLRLPGVDTKALRARYRKDLEAMLAADERVLTAVETLVRKQIEMVASAAKEWTAGARDLIAEGSVAEKLNKTSERVEKAFTTVFDDLREMAEIGARSTEDVIAILTKRFREGRDEVRGSVTPKN